MSSKWTGNSSETGILRKSDIKEKKEELFVFGYSCKLFRNDERALHIDQGKHLIPWMGDETLKIDRYDARGALHDLSRCEAPPGGYDWRVELTRSEQEVELLCDEERYRALHTDEVEELMYKEEELKRLHAAGYGQVGFNYDAPTEPPPPAEADEPFAPAASFTALFLADIVFPETQKQNAIIEKTAKFIASQGAQLEILIKAKQGDNPQFKFMNKDDILHPYYAALIGLVKAEKWPEKPVEVVEEKPPEPDEYLHPSLASTIIESAPSIPSIQYKPSADCDYTMLVSKMRGGPELPPGELPPPGTEPAPYCRPPLMYRAEPPPAFPPAPPAPPVLSEPVQPAKVEPTPQPSTGLSLMKFYGSGSDSEMSDSEDSSQDDKTTPIAIPPEDVKLVIEKMSTYVARNGDEFADIVRAKNDPRFTFLDPTDVYHPYYNRMMRDKRGEINGDAGKTKAPVSFSIKKQKEPDPILPKPALPYESSSEDESETEKTEKNDAPKAPNSVTPSFIMNNVPQAVVYKIDEQYSQDRPIKTVETVQHYAPKLVLPEVKDSLKSEKFNEDLKEVAQELKNTEAVALKVTDLVKEVIKQPSPVKEIEKCENPTQRVKNTEKENNIKENDQVRDSDEKVKDRVDKEKEKDDKSRQSKRRDRDSKTRERDVKKDRSDKIKDRSDKTKDRDGKARDRDDSPYKEERKRRDRKERVRESRERLSHSRDREKQREKDRDKKYKKTERVEVETEIISLDNDDVMIDLTGDASDTKVEGEGGSGVVAAHLLRAAALPANSLASAMVNTLETLRKKKAAEEEKKRRREKRRRRERREYEEAEKSHRKSKRRKYKSSDEGDDSDVDSSKKKRRKKDKKIPKAKKKKHYSSAEEETYPLPPHIDLTNTLKELRTNSPTHELLKPDIEDTSDKEQKRRKKKRENRPDVDGAEEDTLDKEEKRRKKKREYSEGEWSSDSENDSECSTSGDEK